MSDSKMSSKDPIDRAYLDHMMSLPEDDFVVQNAGMISGIRIWRAAWEAALAQSQTTDVRGAEPVAWMHSNPYRVDVIHDYLKTMLVDSNDSSGHIHRPLDKSANYAIPLYKKPAALVPDVGSPEMNEAAWKFIESLPEGEFRKAALSNPDIKPAIKAAADHLFSATPPQPAASVPFPEEAQRVVNRLSSSDPDFDDCADAVALIERLLSEMAGPDGHTTWKDAAIAERKRRVAAEFMNPPQTAGDEWYERAEKRVEDHEAATGRHTLTTPPQDQEGEQS